MAVQARSRIRAIRVVDLMGLWTFTAAAAAVLAIYGWMLAAAVGSLVVKFARRLDPYRNGL